MLKSVLYFASALALALVAGPSLAPAAESAPLEILAAGTLAVPFRELNTIFEQRYPDVVVHAQFGGSVKMARQITELQQPARICDLVCRLRPQRNIFCLH